MHDDEGSDVAIVVDVNEFDDVREVVDVNETVCIEDDVLNDDADNELVEDGVEPIDNVPVNDKNDDDVAVDDVERGTEADINAVTE